MEKLNVLSVNISKEKGTKKDPVPSITLTENGVDGDAHSGPWNRQISLLGIESIRKFEQATGRKIQYGEFAENITTEGVELWSCQPLDRFAGQGIELEVTQIGKECHGSTCTIFKEVGNCVMPKEGIFTRVVGSGQWTAGRTPDNIRQPETRNLKPGTTLRYQPKVYSALIITLSDRAYQGAYEDKSGPRVEEILQTYFSTLPSHVPRLTSYVILLPDDPDRLRNALQEAINAGTDFIFTTGGTGIGQRDITPEVVRAVLDKEIPGIMEMIRIRYGTEKPQALLSRSIAGVAGKSLIFTLPGSVKAVGEYMDEILKSLMHLVYMLHGLDTHG